MNKKKSYKNLEAVTDFEKRYGTERSYGEAILFEQKKKFKKNKEVKK
jgi:hypothetical protein